MALHIVLSSTRLSNRLSLEKWSHPPIALYFRCGDLVGFTMKIKRYMRGKPYE